MMRATTSVGPPGANGTITLTGRDGHVSAAAWATPSASNATTSAIGFFTVRSSPRIGRPSARMAEPGGPLKPPARRRRGPRRLVGAGLRHQRRFLQAFLHLRRPGTARTTTIYYQNKDIVAPLIQIKLFILCGAQIMQIWE